MLRHSLVPCFQWPPDQRGASVALLCNSSSMRIPCLATGNSYNPAGNSADFSQNFLSVGRSHSDPTSDVITNGKKSKNRSPLHSNTPRIAKRDGCGRRSADRHGCALSEQYPGAREDRAARSGNTITSAINPGWDARIYAGARYNASSSPLARPHPTPVAFGECGA